MVETVLRQAPSSQSWQRACWKERSCTELVRFQVACIRKLIKMRIDAGEMEMETTTANICDWETIVNEGHLKLKSVWKNFSLHYSDLDLHAISVVNWNMTVLFLLILNRFSLPYLPRSRLKTCIYIIPGMKSDMTLTPPPLREIQ